MIATLTPVWITEDGFGRPWRHRVCWTQLKCPMSGNPNWSRDGYTSIDASITPIILRLNELGHTTVACCSLLPEDHVGDEWPCVTPYILFAEPAPKELTPPGVVATWDRAYWAFDSDPDKARTQWQWLAGQLGVTLL